MGSTSPLKGFVLWSVGASTLGRSKHHYRGNDPLSHKVDKGQDSCPSKLSQTGVQLCYTSSKPTAVCAHVLLFLYLRLLLHIRECVRLHLCVCVCAPRERVMRTAGARLNNQGSLAEKRAGAPTLPRAREKSRAAPVLPSLIISSPRCIRTQPRASKPHTLTLHPRRPTTLSSPRNGCQCDQRKSPLAPCSVSSHLHNVTSGSKFVLLMSIYSMLQ